MPKVTLESRGFTFLKSVRDWAAIAIALFALVVSYMSYRYSKEQRERPVLSVDYLTVELKGGLRTLQIRAGPKDIERLLYLDSRFYSPLRRLFGDRLRIASSPWKGVKSLFDS